MRTVVQHAETERRVESSPCPGYERVGLTQVTGHVSRFEDRLSYRLATTNTRIVESVDK